MLTIHACRKRAAHRLGRLHHMVGDDEAVVLTTLGADPLAAILAHASDDDDDATTLEFALTCHVLNAARPSGEIRTRVLATLRNPRLQAWAASLGCPSPYPYWAEIHGLQGAAKFSSRHLVLVKTQLGTV